MHHSCPRNEINCSALVVNPPRKLELLELTLPPKSL
jgi:hypothetical protein